jgi:hypothetical protein
MGSYFFDTISLILILFWILTSVKQSDDVNCFAFYPIK